MLYMSLSKQNERATNSNYNIMSMNKDKRATKKKHIFLFYVTDLAT
jgi:hypothetical protein